MLTYFMDCDELILSEDIWCCSLLAQNLKIKQVQIDDDPGLMAGFSLRILVQ